jgi:DNA-3-methyladenine glycosylase II
MNKIHPIDYLSQKDLKLATIIKSIGEYSLEKHRNPFESLIQSIIFQQLSGKSANAIYKRFLNYYGSIIPTITPQEIISTPIEILRTEIGLSFRKIEYIKDLSLGIFEKRLNLSQLPEMLDEEIVTELVKVKGIGRWTAEMFLIFCLGRGCNTYG